MSVVAVCGGVRVASPRVSACRSKCGAASRESLGRRMPKSGAISVVARGVTSKRGAISTVEAEPEYAETSGATSMLAMTGGESKRAPISVVSTVSDDSSETGVAAASPVNSGPSSNGCKSALWGRGCCVSAICAIVAAADAGNGWITTVCAFGGALGGAARVATAGTGSQRRGSAGAAGGAAIGAALVCARSAAAASTAAIGRCGLANTLQPGASTGAATTGCRVSTSPSGTWVG